MSNGVYELKAKEKPRWFQFRWRLSSAIVAVARWIYPPNPDVYAFITQQVMDAHMDAMAYGKGAFRIESVNLFDETSDFLESRKAQFTKGEK